MHELYSLKAIVEDVLLRKSFARMLVEDHPDDFGSYFAVYARDQIQIRFVWDGRDGLGLLERREDPQSEWAQIGEPVPERDLETMKKTARQAWGPLLEKLA